jgi:hypothetical protein
VIAVVTGVADLISLPLLSAAATPEARVSPMKINSTVSPASAFGFVSMPPRPRHCIQNSRLLPVASVSYDVVCNIINFELRNFLCVHFFSFLKFLVAQAA